MARNIRLAFASARRQAGDIKKPCGVRRPLRDRTPRCDGHHSVLNSGVRQVGHDRMNPSQPMKEHTMTEGIKRN